MYTVNEHPTTNTSVTDLGITCIHMQVIPRLVTVLQSTGLVLVQPELKMEYRPGLYILNVDEQCIESSISALW